MIIKTNDIKGIDDIFDNMTRDSRSERYSTVDDILADFDKLKGISEILDPQDQVLVQTNPIEDIKFKEGSTSPAETPVSEEDAVMSSASPEDSKKNRPYSYQQRKKRTTR